MPRNNTLICSCARWVSKFSILLWSTRAFSKSIFHLQEWHTITGFSMIIIWSHSKTDVTSYHVSRNYNKFVWISLIFYQNVLCWKEYIVSVELRKWLLLAWIKQLFRKTIWGHIRVYSTNICKYKYCKAEYYSKLWMESIVLIHLFRCLLTIRLKPGWFMCMWWGYEI